jgi:flagellar biosynthesis/type III secretory pathway protein FliH
LKEEGRQQGREEGRQQGREEMKAELRDWYQRMKEAQANNQPFDEPPPFLDSGQPGPQSQRNGG